MDRPLIIQLCYQHVSGSLLDAPRGFEPRLTESEFVVLPLDDGAAPIAAGAARDTNAAAAVSTPRSTPLAPHLL